MNVLFIGYWAFHDGLTSSTIHPHLRCLAGFHEVENVIFGSIERDPSISRFEIDIKKVEHIPLYSTTSPITLLNKCYDFTVFPKKLAKVCEKHRIDVVICRGSPAGAIGYLLWKRTEIKFIVESFEPHADYMLELGVWKKWDPRFLFERYWEKQQKRFAKTLIPLSAKYKYQLIKEGVSETKIEVVPCTVNLEKFAFKESDRIEIRQCYKIDPESMVGVYVGKFGGIYLDIEAFKIFENTLSEFPKPVLILLTPESEKTIRRKAQQAGFDKGIRMVVLHAKHEEIPKFLSASDLAFATIRPAPSRKFCSAIKVGEYYANGLPVIITEGVGDDSDIILNEKLGVIVDERFRVNMSLLKYVMQVNSDRKENRMVKAAQIHRSVSILEDVYQALINRWTSGEKVLF